MPMTAPVKLGSRVTLADNSKYCSFPGGCKAANGDVLVVWSETDSHTTSTARDIKIARKVSGASTFSATVDYRPFPTDATIVLGGVNALTLADGTIILAFGSGITGVSGVVNWTARSSDHGYTWDAPVRIPNNFTYYSPHIVWGNTAGYIAAPPVEIHGRPNELLIAHYGWDFVGQPAEYPTVGLSRSTNGGLSWAADVRVFTYDGVRDAQEPWLLNVQVADGSWELHCYMRSEIYSGGYNMRRSKATNADGSAWSTMTGITLGVAAPTQPSIVQLPDGGIPMLVRDPLSTDYQAGFRFSTNYGASFGSTISVDTSGGQLYGQMFMARLGVMGMAYALDMGPNHPAPDYRNTDANVYYQEYTVVDSAPPDPLTIVGATGWTQASTALTVNGAVGVRTSTQATVYSTTGGIVVFSGTHAGRFSASLDGTSWSSSITVPSGSTTIYLSCLPQSGDMTLSASVGVPS